MAWARVVISAAMLATVGSTLGSIVMLGVLYAKATGRSGPLPLWEYLTLRDIGEEVILSLAMLYAYLSWPATAGTLHSKGGMHKVAVAFGMLALVATRLYYGTFTLQRPGLLAIALVLYVVFIAYPIAWTFARLAPDAEPVDTAAVNRLSDGELYQTILGLFLVVGSLHFMHWVMWSPAAGLINFFGLLVIPVAAVVLGIGARHVLAGACKALEEKPPGWAITVLAIVIGWAAVFYYYFFAHPPSRW